GIIVVKYVLVALLEVRIYFFFSSRRRHTRSKRDWSSDVCSSDLDCHAGTPSHQVRIRRAVQGRRKGLSPAALGGPELRDLAGQRRARAGSRAGRSLETPQRFATRQVPRERTGRCQILDEVLSPLALLGG